MNSITKLPNRPLRQREIDVLDEEGLQIVPYGGVPEGSEVEVYAVKLASNDTAHALVYDDDNEQWRHLASTDASDLSDADSRLDLALDDWIGNHYSGRFEVLKAP
jgi:hypothetical protein